ncbi:MAG: AAA family ATPase [Asgard group archaeon]|nr:AAA family ATPase [Asgard group archaeon]
MVDKLIMSTTPINREFIVSGKVTHIYGPPKSGKSTLSANIAFEFVKHGKKVLIISTERPIEIRMNSMINAESTINKELLKSIVTTEIYSFEELIQVINQDLTNHIKNIDLIIIDSLTASYRFDAGPISLTLLRKALSSLQAIAIKQKIAIMFTNQVSAIMNGTNDFRPVASASTRFYSDFTIRLTKIRDGRTELSFEDLSGMEIESLEPFSIIPAGIEDFNQLFHIQSK